MQFYVQGGWIASFGTVDWYTYVCEHIHVYTSIHIRDPLILHCDKEHLQLHIWFWDSHLYGIWPKWAHSTRFRTSIFLVPPLSLMFLSLPTYIFDHILYVKWRQHSNSPKFGLSIVKWRIFLTFIPDTWHVPWLYRPFSLNVFWSRHCMPAFLTKWQLLTAPCLTFRCTFKKWDLLSCNHFKCSEPPCRPWINNN